MPDKLPEINQRTIVYFPLGIFLALAILSIFIDLPTFVIFLALFFIIGYYIVLIIFELFNK